MDREKEWLVFSPTEFKREDPYTKLLDMLNLLEDERGYRFTEEQAETLQKMITNLIDQIRSYKHHKKR